MTAMLAILEREGEEMERGKKERKLVLTLEGRERERDGKARVG